MKLKTLFIILNTLNLAAVLLVILVIKEYQSAYTKMEQAYISKNHSFLLADELRQSSDDLTRMVRTYVITANPRFKAQYYEVLAIRNGLYPRPAHYNRIYWDFLAVEGTSNIHSNEVPAISLRELMIQAGFTDKELGLLNKSQDQSDALVKLEEQAMNAIDGIYADAKGYYTVVGKPDFTLARELLHSDEYHKSKTKIMQPIDEFLQLLETRTDRSIFEAQNYVKAVKDKLGLVVFFLILLMATSIGIMFHRIIYPLISLKESMLKLAGNDISTAVPTREYNDEIGGMIRAIEIFKDNTKKLIVSEQKVKLLFDSVGEGFFGLDAKGAFSFVNPVACESLGYKAHELIGTPLHKTLKTQDFSTRMSKLLLNDHGTKTTGEVEFHTKKKDTFPAEYTSTPIFDKNNWIEGSVVVFSDITQRKKHEAIMKRAKESAEAANQSKTLFLANMSHELRTPLNAILGFARLVLKDSSLNSTQKENLETIYKSGKHLLNIISEILEVAKLQAGKIEITDRAFDLHSFLKNIVLIFENRAHAKGLAFEYPSFAGLPRFIMSDEQRLRQILFNLLGNAIKFTECGQIRLDVSYKDRHLTLTVSDTGQGISEDDLAIIFKPFEQIKSAQGYNEGTGLGLAITQELITLMHGDIWLESELNEGSKFHFTILAPETFMSESAQPEQYRNLVLAKNTARRYKVLVVDDISENRSLLAQTLQHLGFDTCEAEDGMVALEQLKACQADIIFMDIQMPRMDGFEVIERIRSGLIQPDIPIVLVSANVFEADRQKALDEGANAFIEKPIREEEVIAALQQLLGIEFVQAPQTDSDTLSARPAHALLNKFQLQQLQKAAAELDSVSLQNLLEQFKEIDPQIAGFIQKSLHDYQFKEILSLCNTFLKTTE